MSSSQPSLSSDADYAWEVATLFPQQGEWSEAAYLDLTDESNRRIEFTEGTQAASHLLAGFAVDVAALFAVMSDIPD